MITDSKTFHTLKKSGFHLIMENFDAEYWIVPISGRTLIVTNKAIYRPLHERKRFGGIQIHFDNFDAFISNLCGQFNDVEHELINEIL